MTVYYNEIDPYAAQWLRNLIAAGHIARGDVDERSIADVRPDDLTRYTQCHFFAGIGGWSLALRLAGWADDRSVWTGSCPCQPFSAAGAGKAADDQRHLWPRWFSLIAERRPAIVFGEQVEAAIGWGWLDLVFADLEGKGYACGATVLPACGVGAPHIRQRLWFVGHANGSGREAFDAESIRASARSEHPAQSGLHRELADADGRNAGTARLQRGGEHRQQPQDGRALRVGQSDSLQPEQPAGQRTTPRQAQGRRSCGQSAGSGSIGELGDADDPRSQGRCIDAGEHPDQRIAGPTGQPCELGHTARDEQRQPRIAKASDGRSSTLRGPGAWRDLDWLPCTDGKERPVESGTFPLAHGIPGRVGRLRAYGNAIVPQVAAEFIKAVVGD